MVFAGQHLFKRGQDVLFVIDNHNMRHTMNPVVANRVAVGTVKSRPQRVFAPVHEFCITYQLICTIWANYMHMGEVGLDLQVEAEPEEQTAIWSISPKLCQIAQFLWRGHTLPRQSKKGKEYGTCWNSDDCWNSYIWSLPLFLSSAEVEIANLLIDDSIWYSVVYDKFRVQSQTTVGNLCLTPFWGWFILTKWSLTLRLDHAASE